MTISSLIPLHIRRPRGQSPTATPDERMAQRAAQRVTLEGRPAWMTSRDYDGKELRPYEGRPGALDAFSLPSRVGGRLVYPRQHTQREHSDVVWITQLKHMVTGHIVVPGSAVMDSVHGVLTDDGNGGMRDATGKLRAHIDYVRGEINKAEEIAA